MTPVVGIGYWKSSCYDMLSHLTLAIAIIIIMLAIHPTGISSKQATQPTLKSIHFKLIPKVDNEIHDQLA